MKSIPKSGRYLPNKLGYVTLLSLQDVMGKNGVNAVLNLANLRSWINAYPSDTLERHVDFAEYSAINGALDDMYGPRGARGLAMRAGRATFDQVLRNFNALASVGDFAFKLMSPHAKLKFGLSAIGRILSQVSDQHVTITEQPEAYLYTVDQCSVCWGRHAEAPSCNILLGMLQSSVKLISGGSEFSIVETRCCAVGDPVCEFTILKEPLKPEL